MGWTVLYIAFGLVALWLLGEVLLQYKARLRWRLLAFGGFLGVVLGVAMPSIMVIAAGAVAFAVGQTLVTLSFRKGFSTGWALGGGPGTSRRRRPVQPMDPVGNHADDGRTASDGYPDDYQRGYDDPTTTPDPAYDSGGADHQHQDAGYAHAPGDGGYDTQGAGGYDTQGDGRQQAPGYGYETAPAPGYGPSYDSVPGYPAARPQQHEFGAAAQFEPAPSHQPAVGQAHPQGGYPGALPTGDYGSGGYHGAPRPDGAPAHYTAPTPTEHGFSHQGYSDPLGGSGASFGDYGQLYGDNPQAGEYDSGYPGQYPAGDPYSGYDPGAQWPGAGQQTTVGHYPETPPGGVWMPQQREAGVPENYPPSYGYPQPPEPQGYYDGRRY